MNKEELRQNKNANYKVDTLYTTWQEWQYVVQTLDGAEIEKIDVQEVRNLIDERP